MNKKVALVIGGNGGIGLEIVNSLIKNGFFVCCTYNKKREKIDSLLNELKTEDVSLHQMNFSNNESVEYVIKGIYKNFNKIDVVVCSVTLPTKNKRIFKMSWSDFEDHIDLQTKGFFHLIQSMEDQIKTKYKTKFIVILTEYCIGKPPSGLADYVTSKYSLMGFAKTMAVELSKYNCTVNMVSPGMVQTGLISGLPNKLIEMVVDKNPLKRIASPKDVADVVLFLSSDKSDYLNSVNITVNGGSVML